MEVKQDTQEELELLPEELKQNFSDVTTHKLIPANNLPVYNLPQDVLSVEGESSNLKRSTREVADRIIFVDNIADSMSKAEFVKLVRQYAVQGPIVDIKFVQRTKGGAFAFVEFQEDQDGINAVKGLNNKDFATNSGQVEKLRASKAENPSELHSKRNIYVKKIPHTWTNDDLKERFKKFGAISHCRTLKKPGNSKENTGVGFVHFVEPMEAARAIEVMDNSLIDPEDEKSGHLEVKFARAKKSDSRGAKKSSKRKGKKNRDFNQHGIPNWGRGRGMPNWGRGRDPRTQRGNQRGRGYSVYSNEEIWQRMISEFKLMQVLQTPYLNSQNFNQPPSNYPGWNQHQYNQYQSPAPRRLGNQNSSSGPFLNNENYY